MSNPYWDAFFELHRDLPREGPGLPEDVAWAAGLAGLAADAQMCDVACGPGADIPALRAAAPQGSLYAFDKVEHFVAEAQARYGDDPLADIAVGDMNDLPGTYDFVWCAGAIYFMGVTEALTRWRSALLPGGTIAFSQVCWFTQTPSQYARDGWADYPDMTDEAGVCARVAAAGYEVLATRRLSDAAWEAYYTPLDARVAALRPNATGALADVLQESEAEAALWRDARDEFGYLLCVVRPA